MTNNQGQNTEQKSLSNQASNNTQEPKDTNLSLSNIEANKTKEPIKKD